MVHMNEPKDMYPETDLEQYPERNIEQYLEYENVINRAGLLGDISSMLGNLGISINTINGVEKTRRGLIVRTDNVDKLRRFIYISQYVDDINIIKVRSPQVRDRLAVRHGRFIKRDEDKKTYRFTRDEIGILVDFLGEIFLEKKQDRKSTRLNSSHVASSYAVFCLKKKKTI